MFKYVLLKTKLKNVIHDSKTVLKTLKKMFLQSKLQYCNYIVVLYDRL